MKFDAAQTHFGELLEETEVGRISEVSDAQGKRFMVCVPAELFDQMVGMLPMGPALPDGTPTTRALVGLARSDPESAEA